MIRRSLLAALLVILGGCATGPPPPIIWYLVSPTPTANYPHGDLSSPMWSWEQVRNYPSASDCQNALQDVHNQIHRPVACIASNDRRLQQE